MCSRQLCWTLAVVLSTTVTFAQYIPGANNNVTELSHLDLYAVYSNIWGYTDGSGREYALVGVDAGLSIVDISDPSIPVEVDLIPGPTAPGTIWREIKTYENYAYIVSEHTSPNTLAGIQIIDLSTLPDSAVLLSSYLWPGVNSTNARAHSISVDDQGFLYIQGGTSTLGSGTSQGGIRIFDLTDPVNPIPTAVFAPRYVHDSFIRDTLLFASDIFDNGHVDIVSVADRSNPTLVHSLIYPNGFSHNSGTTVDGNHLITTDEMSGLTVKFWDISVLWDSDPANNDQIDLVAEYIGDPAQIAHNVHVRNSYAYLSHYAEGVKVLDVANPADPVEVGYFDTYQQPGGGFSGDWGVFPHFPSGTFVVSDIQNGLYVLRFDSVRAGGAEGIVTSAQTGDSLNDVAVSFIEANKTVVTGSNGDYELRTNEGMHTIIFSKPGFISDTVSAQIPSGANISLNIALEPLLVELELSAVTFNLTLPVDTVATTELIVQNTGIGTLLYTINDIQGTHSIEQTFIPQMEVKVRPFEFRILSIVTARRLTESVRASGNPDTIIVDPLNDLVFGSEPDFRYILATTSDTDVTFDIQFAENVNTDSAVIIWSLDVDFDSTTGAYPGGFGFNDPLQGIGAEYDILVDIPGVFGAGALAVFMWVGSNTLPSDPPIYTTTTSVAANIVSFTIPYSAIGNDDGNLAAAGYAGHFDEASGTLVSLDFAPNVGYGTVGINPFDDLPWLSLSSKGGQLGTGEADTIILTFDTHGLDSGQVYEGALFIASNDPDEGEIFIPVTLSIPPLSDVGLDDPIPSAFELQQNYPNPFNASTRISFALPRLMHVVLKVYGVLGEDLGTLINQPLPAGRHSVSWDAQRLATGVYFYRLFATPPRFSSDQTPADGQGTKTTFVKKMLLLR